MAINFRELPKESPNNVPAPGYYKARITKAEMRAVKSDPTKPDFLNLTMALIDGRGQKAGTLFDTQRESAAPAMQFKLQRFMTALGLTTLVSFDLKDLIKLVENRELVVEVENVPDWRDRDLPVAQQRPTAQARVFGSDIYWPVEEFEQLLTESGQNKEPLPALADDDFPFDAADGEAPPTRNEY